MKRHDSRDQDGRACSHHFLAQSGLVGVEWRHIVHLYLRQWAEPAGDNGPNVMKPHSKLSSRGPKGSVIFVTITMHSLHLMA